MANTANTGANSTTTKSTDASQGGVVDNIGGKAGDAITATRDAIGQKAGPLVEQARGFAKARPFATAALAGVVGIALLNTLRGRTGTR